MLDYDKGMFGSCFCKLFLRTIFENTEKTILVFSKSCFCSLNSVFFVFFVFSRKKKKIYEPNVFSMFFLFLLFLRT